ncbi:uncharacterized protein LOC134300350 [Trichomycterus rosablanca]|uniref:uncharacterized protein LOC134300350 n=1 Tax=Trichomycterus rosablanca TaxID=2290929 RepID=UPI002F35D448
MDTKSREQLQEQLGEYILDTLKYIQTIKEFCGQEEKWTLQRETELETMRDIKDRADKISLRFDHVQNSTDKAKAFGEYLWSGLTQITADSKKQELEKELGEVLMGTLEGLKKLQHFLESIEMLAVTSLFVFSSESFMPSGVTAASVRSVISNARRVSPLLIHFKRDAEAFFLPSLSNVDVLAFQLDKYIRITQQLCEKIEKTSTTYSFLCRSRGVSGSGNGYKWKNGNTSLKFTLSISEESVQKLSDHLTQLNKIRADESLRLTFLFDKEAQRFIGLFSQRSSRMFQFLSDLEETAVQLDRMKMGSNISTVAGSSVGIAGGVLSIVGLALAPVTAGVSLALTLTGVGLGVTSGVNSIVTSVTEVAVNSHHGKNANNIFIKFMEDLQKLLEFSEEVASSEEPEVGPDVVFTALETGKIIARAGVIPNLAADLPDIGQAAKGTPLALSQSARAGFITLNALFIGLDVLFICKDSISLAKGSKNEAAQLIRARSVLWRSEVEALEKVSNHLCKGIWKFRKSQAILEQPFHP